MCTADSGGLRCRYADVLARIRKTEVEAQGRYRKLWLERHKLWYSLLYRQAIVRFVAKFNSEEYADPPKRKTMYAPFFYT